MPIGHKTPLSRHRGLQMRKRADIDGSKPGKNTDSIAILGAITEIHWLAIRKDEVHFSVRNTDGFDRVFDRATDNEGGRYGLHLSFGWKKVIQLRIKSDADLFHYRFWAGILSGLRLHRRYMLRKVGGELGARATNPAFQSTLGDPQCLGSFPSRKTIHIK